MSQGETKPIVTPPTLQWDQSMQKYEEKPMKFIKSILLGLALITSLSSVYAADRNSSFSFNKLQKQLCENAKLNQVIKLRYNLRQARTHIRSIYSDVSCHGKSLLSIATDNGANEMADYLELRASPSRTEVTSQIAAN